MIPELLVQVDVLHGLGCSESAERASFVLRDDSGVESRFEIEALRAGEQIQWISALVEPIPAYRKNKDLAYWFEVLHDSKALYFQYNSCRELPERPMSGLIDDLFGALDENHCEKLVIDLRFNEGGNTAVIQPFLRRLEARPALYGKQRCFVLIGRRTFSSGSLLAREFELAKRATLVGEGTGGNPASPFRESMHIELPNSKLAVGLTWRFVGLGEGGPAVEPNLQVLVSSDEYFAGLDPVLEAALR
jgi:hypothetical protein